jgi:pantoate--beta-alanine ligase
LPKANVLLTLNSHIESTSVLHQILADFKSRGLSIGFVPTMGALHIGHRNLVEKSVSENDQTFVSIFVNPAQFNNADDLNNYPRTLEKDLIFLADIPNLQVFAPTIQSIYPENESFSAMDLGALGQVLEGQFRPGHFDGVVHVVHNLFQLVQPDRAYFGKKDFQQLAIIRKLQAHYKFPIDIVGCETVREPSGLALSSRNLRLSESQKSDALIIYETLRFCKTQKNKLAPQELKQLATDFFLQGNLTLEYLEIVNVDDLLVAADWSKPTVCSIAAFCGEVRLIDNMEL